MIARQSSVFPLHAALSLVLFFLALLPGRAVAQDRGLTLAEVYALAREASPRLSAARAAADAAAAQAPSAGLPPDPVVQVGVMNFSLPGFSASMPTSMAPAIQAMQMLPFPGKLSLSKRIAEQSTAMARADAAEAWWEVRARAAMSFYELYEIDRRIEVMREMLGLLQDFEKVARAMYAAGTGRQSDVLRAGVEVARMQAEITRMEAMRRAAAARLNAVLNRPADTPVPTPILPALPVAVPGADTLRAWAERSRPMLARARARVEQARTRLSLAKKEIWPDFTLGLQYGRRSGAMGVERMGSAMIGFSLPVFATKRQLRMRDEAAAMERMTQAELTDMRAQVGARIGELVAELDRARALVRLYRTEVLPQAQANVQSALSSYRVGSVDFMTLVDAQMTLNQYRQEYYALLAAYGSAAAELEMTVGRELPAAGEVLGDLR